MNYGALELDIVAKLAVLTEMYEAEVVPCPDVQAQFKTPTTKPRVTVSYSLSDFMENRSGNRPPVNSIDGTVQEETIEINLEIEARTLRSTGGIYNVIEQAKKALVNYEPLNGELDKIKLKMIKFEDFSEGIWTYMMVISTVGKVVGDYADEDGPGLESLTFDQNFDT